jgi:hypothetical protein
VLLADYLAGIEAGQIILVASYGEAWNELTEEAVAALQGFGIEVTLEEMQDNYLAAAGVQGATPGGLRGGSVVERAVRRRERLYRQRHVCRGRVLRLAGQLQRQQRLHLRRLQRVAGLRELGGILSGWRPLQRHRRVRPGDRVPAGPAAGL